MGTPEPSTPGPATLPLPTAEFSPIVVHVEYSLRRPADGLQFVLPTEADPYVCFSSHMELAHVLMSMAARATRLY